MCDYPFEDGTKCKEPPLLGSKFCALHIPIEEGEKLFGEEHKNKLRELKAEVVKRKIKRGDFNFEGANLYDLKISEFLETSPHNTELIGVDIFSKLVLKDAKIMGDVIILDKNLRKGAIFENAEIKGSIKFNSKSERKCICNMLSFKNVKISGGIYLENYEIFLDDANTVDFSETKLKTLYINNSEFVRPCGLLLECAEISKNVQIHNSSINGELNLRNAKIGDSLLLINSFIAAFDFTESEIEKNIVLDKATTYQMIHLSNARIGHLIVRDELHAKEYLQKGIYVAKATFETKRSKRDACKIARKLFEELGERELADEHFYWEMRLARKIKEQNYMHWKARETDSFKDKLKHYQKMMNGYLLTKIEWLLADKTCRYGTDWKQAVWIWIKFVLGFFSLVYVILHSLGWGTILSSTDNSPILILPTLYSDTIIAGSTLGSLEKMISWGLISLFRTEYFSIVTATTLGYGDMHPIGVAKLVAALEAIFGMFMWAVFLTVFARKYMR